MEKISVAIVDDQAIFRQSLGLLIDSLPGFECIADAGSGEAFLAMLAALPAMPRVALIDMDMPGMNGIELNEALNRQYPQIKVVVLSVHAQERLISKMIAAGAAAYLVKNCDKEELLMALQTVCSAGYYMNSQVLKAIYNASPLGNKPFKTLTGIPVELTAREKEVLTLICKEQGSAEIAQQLFISIRTVEGHRNNLLLKTNSRNTAGLVLFAVRHHIVEIGW